MDPSYHEPGQRHEQVVGLQAELQQLESKYCALESCLIDPYVVHDPEGRVLHVNSRFEETFGWTIDELQGRTIPFVPADEQTASLKHIEESLAGRGKPLRTRRLTKAGAILSVSISASRFVNTEGAPAGLALVIRVLTSKDHPAATASRPYGLIGDPFEVLENRLAASRDSINSDAAVGNEAVRVLIDLVQDRKSDLQERISHNLEITVRPLIAHLKSLDLTEAQRQLVDALDFSVKHIASYFGAAVFDNEAKLSSREIQICQMIRWGQNSREIARSLGVAYQTVIAHRKNIRKKLGLKGNKGNLAGYMKEIMW